MVDSLPLERIFCIRQWLVLTGKVNIGLNSFLLIISIQYLLLIILIDLF